MKKILIDLNIILDFLNKRNYHKEAAILMDKCVKKEVEGFVCAHEITTLSYFLFKEKRDRSKIMQTLASLLDLCKVIALDKNILKEALISPIQGFEDAVIEVSAIKEQVDYILSRNISDFKLSRIPAYTPEQFFLI